MAFREGTSGDDRAGGTKRTVVVLEEEINVHAKYAESKWKSSVVKKKKQGTGMRITRDNKIKTQHRK